MDHEKYFNWEWKVIRLKGQRKLITARKINITEGKDHRAMRDPFNPVHPANAKYCLHECLNYNQ